MPRIEEYQLHPWGWENDPEVEQFKLGTLDYLSTITYTNTAVYFRVELSQKDKVVAILKEGLERTLAQTRQQVGTIEKDEGGGHSIIRKKTDTVRFIIQHLDGPNDNFPSFEDISQAHFLTPVLGDISFISNADMICGMRPSSHPDNSPPIASFKVNFIRGGFILHIQNHHWSNGMVGQVGLEKQLAANCYAVAHGTSFPSWDMRWLDRPSYGLPGFDRGRTAQIEKLKAPEVQAPKRLDRNMEHKPSRAIVFHLRKSKATELKKAASPVDGSQISTFNAVCALMWRVLTRIRVPVYKPDPSYKPLWGTGVALHKLFSLPMQLQGNVQFDILSTRSSIPELTVAEIVSEAPLSKLASYARQMTNSVTHDMLNEKLAQVAAVQNNKDLAIHVDAFPPMSILVTDWRIRDLCSMDFGFGKPEGYRHLFGGAPLSQAMIYPPRKGPAGDDEGMEVQFMIEVDIVDELLKDAEWGRYFEYRGVEAYEEGYSFNPRPKL